MRTPRTRHARAWPYLTPVVVAFAVWIYGPLLATVALSVAQWDLTSGPPRFVGAANYRTLLAQPEFLASLGRTLALVGCLLPVATVLPMSLAIALWKRPGRASTIYRAVLFLPVVLAPVATAVSWQFVLNPLQGVLDRVLALAGVAPANWLGDPHTALPVIAAITAGKLIALNTLLYGAALSGIDPRVLAAARLDGASEWETTRHLVLSHLRRITVLLAGVCVVLGGQWAFTNVAVLTQGGPDGVTDNVYYRIYTYGFTFFDTGVASAAAVVLIAVLALPLGVRALTLRRRSAGDHIPERVDQPTPARHLQSVT